MIPNRSTLVLDFDGVICNSIDECLLTSYNAYHDTNITEVTEIPQTFRNYFRKYRHMVRPAGEYYLLYVAFDVQTEPLNHEVFLELRDQNQQTLDDFSGQFFAERTAQKDNITNWLSLHNIYPHVSDFLKKHDKKIFIVTTKDGDSVSSLMEYFGFAKMVQEIYSNDVFRQAALTPNEGQPPERPAKVLTWLAREAPDDLVGQHVQVQFNDISRRAGLED